MDGDLVRWMKLQADSELRKALGHSKLAEAVCSKGSPPTADGVKAAAGLLGSPASRNLLEAPRLAADAQRFDLQNAPS